MKPKAFATHAAWRVVFYIDVWLILLQVKADLTDECFAKNRL